jgi:hypothetical protein
MNTDVVEGYAVPVTVTGTAYPSTAPVFIAGFFDDVYCK